MATDPGARLALYEELLRRFASGARAAQLYAADHPLLGRNVEGLLAALKTLQQQQPSIAVGIVDNEFVVADTPLPKASAAMKDLIDRLLANKIERISFERGVTAEEVIGLMLGVAKLPTKAARAQPAWSFPHIRVGRITAEEPGRDGIASDMAAIRQLYASAVSAAETAWESAAVDGKPDVPAALHAVEGLADAVTQNRTALVALTAMRNYDNYTFTHMVNVSILTMGQARALGIEGRLLREFGLSALMHDIGKVRTPKEILQKPERLTEQEFVIMRRHPVEGAEILRRTPEMPILAPVVAFEHHLRLDGTRLSRRRQAQLAQPRHDDLQHRRRLRRDAVAARVPTGVPHRSRPRGPQEGRRRAFRGAARPAFRAAARHLSAGHAGQAGVEVGRGRDARARARSVSAARQDPVRPRRYAPRHADRTTTSGSARPTARRSTAWSRRSTRRRTASTRSISSMSRARKRTATSEQLYCLT